MVVDEGTEAVHVVPDGTGTGTGRLRKEFIAERSGKSFALYSGLLDLAHQEGLKSIRTKLLQIPSAENGMMAICWAEVETNRGVFTGIGDASPENVGRMIAPHLCRMSETRAKARALRDAVNVGVAAMEELGEDEGDQIRRQPRRASPQAVRRDEQAGSPPNGEDLRQTAREIASRATTDTSDPSSPAIPSQLKAILDMRGKLGIDIPDGETLTFAEAVALIRSLSAQFNARMRERRIP